MKLSSFIRPLRCASPFPPASEARDLAARADAKAVARDLLTDWVESTTRNIGERAQAGARGAFAWLPGNRGDEECPRVSHLVREGAEAALRAAGYGVEIDGSGRVYISW